MENNFEPNCLPLLIGSIPLTDHQEATELVLEYTPQIPLWVQLPHFSHEGMISQFLPGMPGYSIENGNEYIQTGNEEFHTDLVEFYEEYMAVTENYKDLNESKFAMDNKRAQGFFTLMEKLQAGVEGISAVKGQITGPITFATGVKDQNKKAIFYEEQIRDAAVKHLGLIAAWQTEQLSRFNLPVIVFFDEPALAGFGSSEFISISKKEVMDCFSEVNQYVQQRGGLTGIHVCANADWSIILDSETNILSFDAYCFFDKLLIFSDSLKKFLQRGGQIAWGIVPTQNKEDIDRESVENLYSMFTKQLQELSQNSNLSQQQIMQQTYITPSCGTGSLDRERAEKVLALTRGVSDQVRANLIQ
ncbi:MAG: hypothetical protein ACOCZ2_03660 [Thermodesulfobacteriota bacterium]